MKKKPIGEEPTPEQIEALNGLARYAIEEHKAGRTRDLREYARENGIDLSDPGEELGAPVRTPLRPPRRS